MNVTATSTETPIRILHGAVSPETAHVVDDYPHGFRKRCKTRYWVETKEGEGQRVCTQTTRPDIKDADLWQGVKASTYATIKVLFVNPENGHVESDGFNVNDVYDLDQLEARIAKYGPEAFADPYRSRKIDSMLKLARAYRLREESRKAAEAAGLHEIVSETKREVQRYEVGVKGVFGRNRSEKRESFFIGDWPERQPVEDVRRLALAKVAEIGLKAGGRWVLTVTPVTIEERTRRDGKVQSSESFMILSGEKVAEGTV